MKSASKQSRIKARSIPAPVDQNTLGWRKSTVKKLEECNGDAGADLHNLTDLEAKVKKLMKRLLSIKEHRKSMETKEALKCVKQISKRAESVVTEMSNIVSNLDEVSNCISLAGTLVQSNFESINGLLLCMKCLAKVKVPPDSMIAVFDSLKCAFESFHEKLGNMRIEDVLARYEHQMALKENSYGQDSCESLYEEITVNDEGTHAYVLDEIGSNYEYVVVIEELTLHSNDRTQCETEYDEVTVYDDSTCIVVIEGLDCGLPT